MLHWLAGQKAPDGSTDPDAAGYVEPPETPAPVFAVRAFKHAFFGTPQTAQPNPRRHSNVENGRPKNIDPKPTRPAITRPKSAGEAQTLARQDVDDVVEPLSSPTKGILLTPGTAAARKKNVTFGEHVLDNEEKRPLKSGLPDDCPGKFPSPWNKSPDELKKTDENEEKSRTRGKLAEAFEQARDDSRKRKHRSERRSKKDDFEELSPDFQEPRSPAGKYWKREYDIYRENTQREVKKLITKQSAAKSFAREKDQQCTELTDQLRQEKQRAENLESTTAELTSQMKTLQEKVKASEDAEKRLQDEIAMLKRQLGRRDSARPDSSHGARPAPLERQGSDQSANKDRPLVPEDPVQRPSEPYNLANTAKPSREAQTARGRAKPKSDDHCLKPNDDIWAQSFGSSSPFASRTAERLPPSSQGGRAVTTGTDATPLKALSINMLNNSQQGQRTTSGASLEVHCKSTKSSPKPDDELERNDSPLRSPELPAPSLEVQSGTWSVDYPAAMKRDKVDEKRQESSLRAPESSPFQPEVKVMVPKTAPSGPRAAPEPRAPLQTNTKENVVPVSKPSTPQRELNVKPSALWSSINAPQATNRSSSMVSKDGKEVSAQRLEAARARINARGRVVS